MTNNSEVKIDFFGDGMRIFLDYILRQQKKNPDYQPHPVVRAFTCALQGIDDCKVGQTTMGFSSDGTEKNICEPYAVVLKKKEVGVEVQEIKNLKVDKTLPLDCMIIIFRLQIYLDKISGETVMPQQMVDALNEVIPGKLFYALGDRWKEARDLFREKLKQGKVFIPPSFPIEEITRITYSMPWDDYTSNARALIGQMIIEKLEDKNVRVVITSPKNCPLEKYKVYDYATEFMIGRSSEYLKSPTAASKAMKSDKPE
jgi:hypothetical protein